nr:MAG TPA: hypothetical protein [Caudoviricetes sp.]
MCFFNSNSYLHRLYHSHSNNSNLILVKCSMFCMKNIPLLKCYLQSFMVFQSLF